MGGDIVLCNVPDKIVHVFDVLDLTEYLTIASNIDSAMQLCGAEAPS
jgi:anti-anti-sigma regulatory factor